MLELLLLTYLIASILLMQIASIKSLIKESKTPPVTSFDITTRMLVGVILSMWYLTLIISAGVLAHG